MRLAGLQPSISPLHLEPGQSVELHSKLSLQAERRIALLSSWEPAPADLGVPLWLSLGLSILAILAITAILAILNI